MRSIYTDSQPKDQTEKHTRGIQEQIIRDGDEGRGSTSERRSLTIRKYLGSELDEWTKKRKPGHRRRQESEQETEYGSRVEAL